jgi:uridine kinase
VSVAPSPPPEPSAAPRARIVLLAGPSGSGKSHLAARSGLPTVCLDDFYKDGDDPTLPRSELGIADWDHPDAWDAQRALVSLSELATTGTTWLPAYDFSLDRTTGTHVVHLGDAPVFVAEGIFAAHLIGACRELGLLADALCLTHRPTVTFWRRLARDLREGRKSPWILLRRGLALRRREPAIVAEHVSLGATPVHGEEALRRLRRVTAEQLAARDDGVAA